MTLTHPLRPHPAASSHRPLDGLCAGPGRARARGARGTSALAAPWALALTVSLSLSLSLSAGDARAAGGVAVYGLFGIPGPVVGVGFPVGSGLTLRADIGGIDKISRTVTEDGITYDASGKATRIGLFADWFPWLGSFRLTGGLTLNDMKLDLDASGAGRVLQIGSNTYTLGADDRYQVRGEFPAASPYLGLGWGHHASHGAGWGFVADLGLSFGSPKVNGRATGPWASQPGLQADIDRETQTLRDTVGNFRVIPQLSVGVNYRFR